MKVNLQIQNRLSREKRREDFLEKRMKLAFRKKMIMLRSRSKTHNTPIAKYDVSSNRAYLEWPDGRREYVDVKA